VIFASNEKEEKTSQVAISIQKVHPRRKQKCTIFKSQYCVRFNIVREKENLREGWVNTAHEDAALTLALVFASSLDHSDVSRFAPG